MRGLACVYCAALSPFFSDQTKGRSHNAHTENGGRGRKGDFTTIIPLCASHHRLYDEHAYPFDKENQSVRDAMNRLAPSIEYLWQLYLGSR